MGAGCTGGARLDAAVAAVAWEYALRQREALWARVVDLDGTDLLSPNELVGFARCVDPDQPLAAYARVRALPTVAVNHDFERSMRGGVGCTECHLLRRIIPMLRCALPIVVEEHLQGMEERLPDRTFIPVVHK